MKVRSLVTFLTFAMMIFGAGAYVHSLGVRLGPPKDRVDLSVSVDDIHGLVEDSSVLLRGVVVGKVTGISANPDAAKVDFYVRDGYPIPADTEVHVDVLSALNETHIGLIPRTADGPMLQNGQHIARESVIDPPSISDLAASVVRVLEQLDPDAVNRIIAESDAALPDPNAALPNLRRASILLNNVANDMQGRGRGLIDNLQVLLQNASWTGPLLGSLSAQFYDMAPRLGAMFSGFAPDVLEYGVTESFVKFDMFVRRIQRLLDMNGGDLRVIGERFKAPVQGISGAILNFDTGLIFDHMVATLPEDGAVPVHVQVRGN